jgi:hypothetical protein
VVSAKDCIPAVCFFVQKESLLIQSHVMRGQGAIDPPFSNAMPHLVSSAVDLQMWPTPDLR